MNAPSRDLSAQISKRVAADSGRVWTPADFAQLANRDAVDKALQRLVHANRLRRIDRGLYDLPRVSALTKNASTPDYRQVLDALSRRDQVRMLVDGLTAANDLGLTDAVPAHVVVHTDTRRRSIKLGGLTIDFRHTAPSRLYWAGRPAMRVVQALHWLKDMLPRDADRIVPRLRRILTDPKHGPQIRQDLTDGFMVLPRWMQPVVRELLDEVPQPAAPSHSARATHRGVRTRAHASAR